MRATLSLSGTAHPQSSLGITVYSITGDHCNMEHMLKGSILTTTIVQNSKGQVIFS